MKSQLVAWGVAGVLCTAIGLGAGWGAAKQAGGGGSAGGHAHGGHGHEEEGHEGHDHAAHDAGPKLSKEALKNIGVETAEAETRPWARTLGVPASIENAPDADLPVVTPVGGRVQEVLVVPGQSVTGGEAVLTVLRDPLPLPSLTLTAEIFGPVNEAFHTALSDLRRSLTAADLARTELKRLEAFAESGTQDGLPVVPRKNLIEVRYELQRAERDLSNARTELRKHGLTDEQISAIEKGEAVPATQRRIWKQALVLNGLWNDAVETIHEALPADLRDALPNIAALAELSAAGRAPTELGTWLKEDPAAAARFQSIAALLQQGASLEHVRDLHAQGAFEALVTVKAPAGAGWDAEDVLVRPGDRVEAGARVAVMHDARRVRMRAEAAGGDAAALLKALSEGTSMEAQALVPGTGPDLKSLKVLFLRNEADDRGTLAFLPAANEELGSRKDGKRTFRSWRLRPGLKYLLRVPVESAAEAIVVPGGAVVEDGADRILFVQDGEGFKKSKVVVLYQDKDVAVLDPKHSEIFPGDVFVAKGAFALKLALQAAEGEAAVDPHAGHSH
jgi:biotin carboxyl carrier protein